MMHRPKNIAQIFGVGGMGKTLYLKGMVRARVRAGGRVLVVDPNGGFDGYGRAVTVEKALQVLQLSAGRPFSLVVRPEWDEEITDVFGAAYEAGNLLLAVDEAADFGGRLNLDRNFLRVVQKGRNRAVDVATTCQNTTDLDPRVRLNYSSAVCFRQTNPSAAERFAVEYASRPELAAILPRLPRFEYVRADAGGGLYRGRVPDPAVHGPP